MQCVAVSFKNKIQINIFISIKIKKIKNRKKKMYIRDAPPIHHFVAVSVGVFKINC